MNANKNETLLFANEDAIFRIISIAKIVSWIILVIYLIVFVNSISSLLGQAGALPNQLSQWLPVIANLFYAPTVGLFYFLVLQAVAQGLNLGLDIFYGLSPDEEVTEAIEEL
jgi:Zn-dependent protease with chaperone function